VQLCGAFFLRLDGERLDGSLPGRQGRLLFAYLAANRDRPVDRGQLAEVLWPGERPAGADTTLRGLIFRLRQVVGEERLSGKSQLRLALPEGVWIDVEAARGGLHEAESAIAQERWTQAWLPARIALSVAEAGFLPGYEGEWVDAQRRDLDELRLRALECVAEAGLELGGPETGAAERAGRALIEAAPFRESGYRHLMRALEAEGNPAEALRVYERLRSLLREELGISPSAAVRGEHERLIARLNA
jgi:DNA-binding SARP family transcriptional activator